MGPSHFAARPKGVAAQRKVLDAGVARDLRRVNAGLVEDVVENDAQILTLDARVRVEIAAGAAGDQMTGLAQTLSRLASSDGVSLTSAGDADAAAQSADTSVHDLLLYMSAGHCKTGTIKDVNETIEALRAICPRVERCRNRDLVALNNGIYDYGNKILMAFDPAFVFTSKKHVDFVDRARNPVIHNNEDGTDWDVVSWMNELSDDPDVVSLLWQIIGATVRPYVSWNKSAWLYSPSGNNGKGTLCALLRNLCGPGDWTSIPLKNFGKDFMLGSRGLGAAEARLRDRHHQQQPGDRLHRLRHR